MFSKTDLTNLIEAGPAVGISFYLPTQTQGRETRQNAIMLKNLLRQAREQLAALDVSKPEAETLLAPAAAMVDDYDFWQHQSHGLALFLSEAGMQSHKLPIPVPELVVAGPGFHIAPLLALQERDATFVILTMTADAAHVWQATRFTMTATRIADLPASIESLDEAPDYEGPLQSHGFGRPNTGGLNMPKTQVYGDSPEDWRKGRLVEYARRTAAALAAHLAGDPLRIVVVADAEIGGHVLKDEALAPLIAGFTEINPASLDEAGLHAAACAVMQPIHDKARDEALERLDALVGRGDAMACLDPVKLSAAAQDGRVDQLFVGGHAVPGGTLDPDATGAAAGEPGTPETQDLVETQDMVDRAAQMTLRNGGVVWVVAPHRLPDGISLAATLRY